MQLFGVHQARFRGIADGGTKQTNGSFFFGVLVPVVPCLVCVCVAVVIFFLLQRFPAFRRLPDN